MRQAGSATAIGFIMKVNVFLAVVIFALLLCGSAFAQNLATTQTPKPQTPPTSPPPDETPAGGLREEEHRLLVLDKMRRDHSDASGHIRPDLFAQALAHMHRMRVAKQIGPETNTKATPVKKP